MTNVQAAIGCAQMERLDTFVARKKEIHGFYESELSDVSGLSFFPVTEGTTCWYSGIVLEKGCLDDVRRICSGLREQDVESRPFWKPVHMQKPYHDVLRQDLNRAESIWQRIVTLPCSTGITDEELYTVARAVKGVLSM